MKTLRIGTKAQANKVLTASLFTPVNGRTLNDMKLDGGKYSATPATPYLGREVEVGDNIFALYTVRRSDSDGPYVQVRCICS